MTRSREIFAYVLWQLPGWCLAAIVGLWFEALVGLPAWAGETLVGLLILKDLALFPAMRVVFSPPRTNERLVGARGRVVQRLAPVGYVRVMGELWNAEARAAGRQIDAGTPIVVRDARGLTLLVEEEPPAGPPSGAT
jgi:membrane protein implicated in regulation of membrane protease activity